MKKGVVEFLLSILVFISIFSSLNTFASHSFSNVPSELFDSFFKSSSFSKLQDPQYSIHLQEAIKWKERENTSSLVKNHKFSLFFLIQKSSEEAVNLLYYCQSSSLCYSHNEKFQLIRTSVFTSQGTQNRWYLEELFSEPSNKNPPTGSQKKRIFGAIEISSSSSSSSSFQLKKWKKLTIQPQMEEEEMKLLPYSPSCSLLLEERMEMEASLRRMNSFVEVFLLYHSLLLQTNPTSSSSSLSSDQELILTQGRIEFINCLETILSNLDKVDKSTSPALEEDRSLSLIHLQPVFSCLNHFYNFNFLDYSECSTELSVKMQAMNFTETGMSLIWFYQIYEMIIFQQLLISDNFTTVNQFYSDLCDLFISRKENQLLSLETSNLLFLIHLIEGKLFSWEFGIYDNNLEYFFTTIEIKSESLLFMVPVQNILKYFLRFKNFYFIYSLPFDNSMKYYSQNVFSDLLMKYEFILNKIISLTKMDSDNSVTKVNQRLSEFFEEEYPESYATMILFSFLNLGSINNALSYFETNFAHKVHQSQNVFSHTKINCYGLFEILLLDSRLISCENVENVIARSKSAQGAFKIFYLIHGQSHNYPAKKIIQTILSEDKVLFNQFSMIMSQIMNPVILSELSISSDENFGTWAEEALLLRLIFVKLYDSLINFSVRHSLEAEDFPDDSIVGTVRGLFLEAYQGLNLLIQFYNKYYRTSYSLEAGNNTFVLSESFLSRISDPSTTSHFLKLVNLPKSSISLPPPKKRNITTIKVAFLSYSFSRHSVGRLIAKVIEGLSNQKDNILEIFLLTNQDHPLERHSREDDNSNLKDDVTYFLGNLVPVAHWINIVDNRKPIHDILSSLSLDILIYTDLLMQSTQYLFVYRERFAPIQIIFWGHPYTTSNPFIDYYITSSTFEPLDSKFVRFQQFTEQLIYFDSLSFQLFPPEKKLEESFDSSLTESYDLLHKRKSFIHALLQKVDTLQGRPLSLTEKSSFISQFQETNVSADAVYSSIHLYGVLQSLMKMHPLFDLAIIKLLQADSNSVIIILKNTRQFHWQFAFQKRLARLLQTLQLPRDNFMSRLLFIKPMKHLEYSSFLCSLDVILDPFPFGGGVTMCDAIGGSCTGRVTKDRPRFVSSLLNYSNYSPIPYVTMNDLQSIHRIGVGIAEKINRTDLTRIIRDKRNTITEIYNYIHPFISNPDHSFINVFLKYCEELIDEYVQEAILLAEESNKRFFKNQSIEMISDNEIIDKNQAFSRNQDPYFTIYESQEVVDEWYSFLKRVSQNGYL